MEPVGTARDRSRTATWPAYCLLTWLASIAFWVINAKHRLVGLGALASICAVAYTGYLGGKIVIESPILASPTPPIIPASLPTTSSVQVPGQTMAQPGTLPAPVGTTQQPAPLPQAPIPV